MSEAEQAEQANTPAKKRLTNAELQKQLQAQGGKFEETQDQIRALESSVMEQGEKMETILGLLQGLTAKDHPTGAAPGNYFESEEQHQGEGLAQFDNYVDPEGSPEIVQTSTANVESPEFRAKADMLRFMEDRLTVMIGDSGEDNPLPYFAIHVNGRPFFFTWNGVFPNVPRYIVEGLARAKPANYKNEHFVDREGVRGYRYPMTRGIRYPFSVMEDPAGPRGSKWLQKVLQEP